MLLPEGLAERETKMERQFEVGGYAYSSYGYDQTNISFYKVVKKDNGWVTFAPVKQVAVESGHGDYGYTTPDLESEPNLKPLTLRMNFLTKTNLLFTLKEKSWASKNIAQEDQVSLKKAKYLS